MTKIDYYDNNSILTDTITDRFKKYNLELINDKAETEYRFNAILEISNEGHTNNISKKNISALDVVKLFGENKTVQSLFTELNIPGIYNSAIDEMYTSFSY